MALFCRVSTRAFVLFSSTELCFMSFVLKTDFESCVVAGEVYNLAILILCEAFVWYDVYLDSILHSPSCDILEFALNVKLWKLWNLLLLTSRFDGRISIVLLSLHQVCESCEQISQNILQILWRHWILTWNAQSSYTIGGSCMCPISPRVLEGWDLYVFLCTLEVWLVSS